MHCPENKRGVPNWIETIKEECNRDPDILELIKSFLKGTLASDWSFTYGLHYYEGKLFLPAKSTLLPIVIKELHSSTHEGFDMTFFRIKQVFFWKRMSKTIKEVIKTCEVCQRNKSENLNPVRLLSLLPIPQCGKIMQWTSWKDYQNRRDKQGCFWLWIG